MYECSNYCDDGPTLTTVNNHGNEREVSLWKTCLVLRLSAAKTGETLMCVCACFSWGGYIIIILIDLFSVSPPNLLFKLI